MKCLFFNIKKLSLILFIFPVGFLIGQSNNNGHSDTLTFMKAIEIAIKNNYQIRIKKLDERVAKNNNNWGGASLYPTVDLNFGGNVALRNQERSPISFVAGNFGSNSVNGEVALNWTLFNGFKVFINKAKLRTLEELSSGNLAVVVENTIHSVTLGYYDVLLQESQRQQTYNLMRISSDKYKQSNSKKDLGGVSTVDFLQFKVAYLKDSLNYVAQLSKLSVAKQKLNFLLAQPLNTQFYFADSLAITPKAYDKEELKSSLNTSNNAIKNQLMQQLLVQNSKKLAKANFSPALTLNSGYSRTLSGFFNDTSSIFGIGAGNTYLRLAFTYRLFDARKTSRAYRNAKAQLVKEGIKTEELKLKINQDFETYYQNYNLARKMYAINKELVDVAKLNLTLSSKKYDLGVISSFDYRAVHNEYMQAQVTLLLTAYDFLRYHTDLLRITGGFVR